MLPALDSGAFMLQQSLLFASLAFAVCGAIIFVAGGALARAADAIAEATGLGRFWIGSVLLAGATSLPELATDISAVRMGAVDLAVGDLMGSSLANMFVLALVDLVWAERRLLERVALDHVLAAALASSLTALAAVCLLLQPSYTVGWVSPASVLLAAAYAAGARAVFRQARHTLSAGGAGVAPREAAAAPAPRTGLARASWRFGLAALAIVGAAPGFAWSAEGIALATGLGTTFVGTWLVGLSTSLPELVASVAAVRMGAFDLAVGNLFGSNAFNMSLFFALDLAQPGSLFVGRDPGHVLSALSAIVLMALGAAGLVYRAKRQLAMVEPSSLLMVLTYVGSLIVLYLHAGR